MEKVDPAGIPNYLRHLEVSVKLADGAEAPVAIDSEKRTWKAGLDLVQWPTPGQKLRVVAELREVGSHRSIASAQTEIDVETTRSPS